MDNPHPYQRPIICLKHNQPIVVINQDPNIGQCCTICLQLLPGNVPIEQFNQQWQAIYDKEYKEMDLDHQYFQSLSDELLKQKQIIIMSLDKVIQQILNQINTIKDSKIKMSSIIQSNINKEIAIQNIQQISIQQKLINKDVIVQVGNQLKSINFKFSEIINQLFANLQNNQMENLNYENQFMINNRQFKNLQYQLIQESTLKQENKCYSFAFNNNNTILLVGFDNVIIVYEFMNGKIVKELQRLTDHTSIVNCLYFTNKSNYFVSGSGDGAIIVWVLYQNNKWVAHQVLKEHTNYVNCILMNKMEDQLVSGSYDCTLKFWKLMNGSWSCQQLIKTKYYARNMSLNERDDKLIVCENNQSYPRQSSIQILMENYNKQWSIMQTLDFDEFGWRLCFTIGDQFVFSTQNSDLLQIYDYDQNRYQFNKVSQLQIKPITDCAGGFPCHYIKPLSILIFKHGQFLNIIKVNENYKYEQIQEIEFGTQWIFGRMSENGQCLATWNYQSTEIEIRKLKFLE